MTPLSHRRVVWKRRIAQTGRWLHIYSSMKGMTLEDFQKTRNAQVLYSVAGKDEGKTNWDKAQSPAK